MSAAHDILPQSYIDEDYVEHAEEAMHADMWLYDAAPLMLESLEALAEFRHAVSRYAEGDLAFPWITCRELLAEWGDKYDAALTAAKGQQP